MNLGRSVESRSNNLLRRSFIPNASIDEQRTSPAMFKSSTEARYEGLRYYQLHHEGYIDDAIYINFDIDIFVVVDLYANQGQYYHGHCNFGAEVTQQVRLLSFQCNAYISQLKVNPWRIYDPCKCFCHKLKRRGV